MEVVDSTGGGQPSLRFTRAGQPSISYCKMSSSATLHYAYRYGAGWHTQTVDSNRFVGASSLALDNMDLPHIEYYDSKTQDLKYAYYDGASWQVDVVDSTGDVGQYTSLVLDASGNPYISYFEGTGANLKIAYILTALPSVTPESDGVGVTLIAVVAALGCYVGIKRKAKQRLTAH